MSKFHLIVADMPWSFFDRLQMSDIKRGAEANYNTLSFEELKELPIEELSADDALLAMWVPSSLLPQGLELMEHYGFSFKQTFIWVKTKKLESLIKFCKKQVQNLFQSFSLNDNVLALGMGRLFRNSHELCLIGIKGKIYEHLEDRSQRTVGFAYNLKHSQKPELLQDRLDKMFPSNTILKIELFSRRQKKGWFCMGNQSPMTYGENIGSSIKKMISLSEKDIFPINKLTYSYDDEKNQELFKMWTSLSKY